MKRLFRKGELKLLWPFYLNNLTPIFFFYSLFSVLYFTQIGLSFVQIGLLYTIMSVGVILFEIPTGAVADIHGRKASTIIGYFLSALVPLAIYFTTNFVSLMVLYGVWGIASTFISGANDAWVMDAIRKSRIKNLVDNFYAKGPSIYAFSGFLSGLLGAFFVGIFGVKSIWLFLAGSSFLSVIILTFAKEDFKKRKQSIKQHFKEFLKHNKKAIKYSRKDKNISKILFATFFFSTATFIFTAEIIWVPLFKSFGLKDAFLGFLVSASWIVGIFSPHFAKSIYKKTGGRKNFLLIVLSSMVLATIPLIWLNSLIPLIAIHLILLALLDFWAPVNFPLFQSFIPSKMRATILSLRSFIFSLLGAIIPLVVGALAELLDFKLIIVLSGIFLIPTIIIYSKIKEK